MARLKALLDAGANPNVKFRQFTPLMLAASLQGKPPAWVTYSPLLPLALLLFAGLYLFALPHATRWRSRRRTA